MKNRIIILLGIAFFFIASFTFSANGDDKSQPIDKTTFQNKKAEANTRKIHKKVKTKSNTKDNLPPGVNKIKGPFQMKLKSDNKLQVVSPK